MHIRAIGVAAALVAVTTACSDHLNVGPAGVPGAGPFTAHAARGTTQHDELVVVSGVTSSTIDGAARSGIAGGTVVTPAGWASATNKYDIELDGGVSSFVLDRAG
jgi:hypothetical protein